MAHAYTTRCRSLTRIPSTTIGKAGSSRHSQARVVLLTTAAVSVWNAGVGMMVEVLLEAGLKSRWLRI
jgi:hypothetical protein